MKSVYRLLLVCASSLVVRTSKYCSAHDERIWLQGKKKTGASLPCCVRMQRQRACDDWGYVMMTSRGWTVAEWAGLGGWRERRLSIARLFIRDQRRQRQSESTTFRREYQRYCRSDVKCEIELNYQVITSYEYFMSSYVRQGQEIWNVGQAHNMLPVYPFRGTRYPPRRNQRARTDRCQSVVQAVDDARETSRVESAG